MPDNLPFRGRRTCSCMIEWLPWYEKWCLHVGVIQHNLDIYQLNGNAAASAGYHRTGGCGDIAQKSKLAVSGSRNGGAAGFPRGNVRAVKSNDGMVDHQHFALKGCPHLTAGAKGQITSLERGKNGLVNNGPDVGPRTGVQWPLRTYKQGIEWFKQQLGEVPTPAPTVTRFDVGLWNVASPKPGWFPVPWDKRKEAIGAQLKALDCSIYATCETHFSYQTADILRHLGDHFQHVSSPIGNDLFFDQTKYEQTRAFAEYSLGAQDRYAGVLHLTREATGKPFTVVHTHFPYASASLRTTAAKRLVQLLDNVEDDIVLTGDFNNQAFSSGTPHKLLRDAGYEFMREQATVTNGNLPEYPAKGQWLSDIATDSPVAKITSGVLTLTPSTLSDHRPLKARIQIA